MCHLASSWRSVRLIYIGLLNEAGGIHVARTSRDPPFARPFAFLKSVFMPGSPTVEHNLNGVLARVGGISTQQDAQEFVDVVSGVHQLPSLHYP